MGSSHSESESATGVCEFGPADCDPLETDGALCCSVCGKYACDYHGDYPTEQDWIEGDWRCPDCKPEVVADAA